MSLVCEDLATKAELQELKDKINQLFGEGQDGGSIDILEAGALTGTVLLGSMQLAQSSVQDIVIENAAGGLIDTIDDKIVQDLANGNAKWAKVKHWTQVREPLPKLTTVAKNSSKTLVTTTAVGTGAAAAGTVAAGTIALVASLAGIVGNLAINIASTRVLGFRIDQVEKALLSWNTDYQNLIRLYQAQGKNLDKVTSELQKTKVDTIKNKNELNSVKGDLTDAQETVTNLDNELNTAKSNITDLQNQNDSLQTQLDDLSENTSAEIDALKQSSQDYAIKLQEANSQFDSLLETTQSLGKTLADYQAKTDVLILEYQKVSEQTNKNTQEIQQLKTEIAQNKELYESELDSVEARLILAEQKLSQQSSSGGGFPQAAKQETATSQEKILELMKYLVNDPNYNVSTSIDPNTMGVNNPFPDIFNQILPNIDPSGTQMTPEQLTELNTNVTETITNTIEGLNLDQVPGDLAEVKQNTQPDEQKKAAKDAICEETEPGKCIDTKVTQPIKDTVNNTYNNLNITLIGLPDLFPDCCDETNQKLNEIKEFLEKAWQSTTEDKKINAFNNSLLLHNAMLLSQDVNTTIPAIQNFSTQNLELKDYLLEDLEIATKINQILLPFPSSVTNLQNELSLQSKLINNSQIVRSSQGTISSIDNCKTSTLIGINLLGKYLSQGNNALIQQGILEPVAYPWQWENMNLQSMANGYLEKYLYGSSIQSDIKELSIHGLNIIETSDSNINGNQQFLTIQSKIDTEVNNYIINKQTIEDAAIAESLSPTIELTDLAEYDPE